MIDSIEQLEALAAAEATAEGFILLKLPARADGREEEQYALLDLNRDADEIGDYTWGGLSTLTEVRTAIRDCSRTMSGGDPRE